MTSLSHSLQVASLINMGSNYLNAGVEGRRWGTAHASIVPYQAFRTADGGWLVVGGGNDAQYRELCKRIGRLDLLDEEEYKTNAQRVKNRKRLVADLQKT